MIHRTEKANKVEVEKALSKPAGNRYDRLVPVAASRRSGRGRSLLLSLNSPKWQNRLNFFGLIVQLNSTSESILRISLNKTLCSSYCGDRQAATAACHGGGGPAGLRPTQRTGRHKQGSGRPGGDYRPLQTAMSRVGRVAPAPESHRGQYLADPSPLGLNRPRSWRLHVFSNPSRKGSASHGVCPLACCWIRPGLAGPRGRAAEQGRGAGPRGRAAGQGGMTQRCTRRQGTCGRAADACGPTRARVTRHTCGRLDTPVAELTTVLNTCGRVGQIPRHLAQRPQPA